MCPLEIDTYHAALVDDSGSGTDGSIWDKADVATIKDAFLSFGVSTELTIATDAVTVTRNKHSVDTEADAAADNLSTINSGTDVIDGHVVVLKPELATRVVTVKHNIGNIQLKGGDFVMNDANHRLALVRDGTTWYEVARNTPAASTPGGADTQVQFNDASTLQGDAGLTYNKTTDALTLAGLLDISGAAAGQIKFPATQNASANANTLDDYEEGSWTPVIGGSGGTSGQTYTTREGHYVKTGQTVVAWAFLEFSAKGTITGNVELQALPFTSIASTSHMVGPVNFNALATNWVDINAIIQSSSTVASIKGAQAAAASNDTSLVTADINNTSTFRVLCVYRAAA